MSRKAIAIGLAAALLLPGGATAAVRIKGVDSSAYPRIGLNVVTSAPTARQPVLTENGQPVVGLVAENLGRAKSIVLAIDRSQSMAGQAFADAVAAARRFVSTKHRSDRVAIVAFGSRAVQLTRFSSATIDTDTALRSLELDPRQGTALNDAIVASAQALGVEESRGRVIVLLTDGDDVSSQASQKAAVEAARRAGATIYPVAIEGPQFSPTPLRAVARATGGSYYGVSSTGALAQAYDEIARELRRTWRVEYLTAARAGERLALQVRVPGAGSAATSYTLGGHTGGDRGPTGPLPARAYESALSSVVVALAVGLLVLLAAAFALTRRKGSWLQGRLAAHVVVVERDAKPKHERERLAAAASLFRATENSLGHLRFWRKLARLIQRSDLPLRTVEFVYLMAGAGLIAGFLAAVSGRSSLFILVAMAVGALGPYGFVWFKARRRSNAFEMQLPDLLLTMAASLKAGHSFRQAVQSVVDEGQPPASKEFKRVLTETQLGRPMDQALDEMAERVGSKNFDFVITAVTIQRQVGGSLAGLFDMVADTVRQRHQFARKIKGLTAMGRMSAYVLIGLPFFLAFAITMLNRDYMEPLWHSTTGHYMIAVTLVSMAFGSLLLKRIVSFKG
jgi:tight adherence protein B